MGPPWPDSDNRGIDGSRHLPSVSVTHLNAFQSPTIILEPFQTVFECFISQSWSDRPTKQRPGQISDDLGKSPDLYVFDMNYEHLALRRHCMLTPVTALPTIPRKGKRIQFHFYLLKKLLLDGSDRFPPHNRPITIVGSDQIQSVTLLEDSVENRETKHRWARALCQKHIRGDSGISAASERAEICRT